MKNNKRFKKHYIIGLLTLGSLLLAACGNTEQSNEVKAESANNDPDAKEIIVGTGNAYQPFVYLDENGKLTGYEKAVLDEVDQLLPQYKFKYESFEFKNILPALDAGKVDLAAHQYEINDERQKKYLFGKVGYTDYTSYVVVDKASGHDFQSLDDLQVVISLIFLSNITKSMIGKLTLSMEMAGTRFSSKTFKMAQSMRHCSQSMTSTS